MKLPRRSSSRGRRGQATAIGSILFLMVTILLINFLYEVYMIQIEMSQFDAERTQERVEISSVFFGDRRTYPSPNSTTISVGSGTDPFNPPYINSTLLSGHTYPLLNMNFTRNDEGWTFTKSYTGTSLGASGAYTTDVPGSPSGAGAIYVDFAYNPPSGSTVSAVMNWTSRFYINLEVLGGSEAVVSVSLSWGRKCVVYTSVQSADMKVYFENSSGVQSLIDSATITDVDSSWIQRNNIPISLSSVKRSGWYKIIIVTTVTLAHSLAESPEFKAYLDDIGLDIYTKAQVVDWTSTFMINEDPTLIDQLDITYVGHYNITLIQSFYVYDFSSERWILFDRSLISSTPRTLKFTLAGADVQKYVSADGLVKTRVYAVASPTEPFQCIADEHTLSDYYSGATDRITITFRNSGGVSIRLVSLWIIDSVAHHHFDSTSNPPFNIFLSPGETGTYTAHLNWTFGKYKFKVVTDKGTMATYAATV